MGAVCSEVRDGCSARSVWVDGGTGYGWGFYKKWESEQGFGCRIASRGAEIVGGST